MIEVEENGKEYGKWYCDEYISYADVPEMNEPSPISGREERFACGQRAQVDLSHLSDVHESREEYDSKRGAVILDEHSDVVLK